MEKYGTATQATNKRMRSAWWITKATNMYSEYVMLIVFSR